MDLCWCGNQKLDFFCEDYFLCKSCQTLVSKFEDVQKLNTVEDDESDFYGKNYWLESSKEFPDIHVRSRNDLSERNLHWLKYLLEYQLPPAKVLEIGCAHGSFIGLLQHIGFDASGMEMSPWVIDYAKKNFEAFLFKDPIESANLEQKKFDMIVMMDVVEHLSDPITTLKHSIFHLTDAGQFLIQVPCFPNELSANEILNHGHAFKEMMMPNEHLYLYSQSSIQKLFRSLGFRYIEFLPAIFSHYDMFLIASREPFKKNTVEEIDNYLIQTMNGRIVQAFLDLRANHQKYSNAYYQLKKSTDSSKWLINKLLKNILSNIKS